MEQLKLHVTLDPKVEASPQVHIYEGGLEAFYFDLLAGKPYPLTLGVKAITGPETLLAITLWLHRDLLIYFSTPSVVAGFALAAKYPVWGLAHMERDLSRFIQFLRKYPVTTQANVVAAVTLVKEFIFGPLDNLPPEGQLPIIIDVGTNGFVLAKTSGDLVQGWVDLYRKGHLRGLLIGAENDTYRQVLIARKSPWVPLNLEAAAQAFNAMEQAQGELAGWKVENDFLWGPPEGTSILVQHLMEVLLRV